MVKSREETITRFNEYVNMTADELEKWLKSDDSESAGWPKDASEQGGETVGHDSGRKIVEILRSNPDKEPSKYTDEQVDHMRRVVAYCARHLAQEEGMKERKTPEELEQTKSTKSLKNWGHDPLKTLDKGDSAKNDKDSKDSDEAKKEDGPTKANDKDNDAGEKEQDENEGEQDEEDGAEEGDEEEENEEKSGGRRTQPPRKRKRTAEYTQEELEEDAEDDDEDDDFEGGEDDEDEEGGDDDEEQQEEAGAEPVTKKSKK